MSDGARTREQNPSREQILSREVFIRGANHPFGDLTLDDARARAEELRAVSGWGPTVRVVPVAHAWRELAISMERAGAESVSELDGETLSALAERLWVVLPSGPMMS
jgi:hypothetical protein